MSYSVYENKQDCCGCSACMNICPKGAITMTADDEGFLYPVIDTGLCVECGLCKKVCDFQKEHEKTSKEPPVYAVKTDDNVRKDSTSAGMYKMLSDLVLQKDGAVYGAAFDDDMCVLHTRATTVKQSEKHRGSKYVQSDLGDVFALIKKDLADSKYVLFSGTSCQVAGLISFLGGKNTQKLLCVEILCHGVPSPLVFSKYIDFVQKKRNKKVLRYLSRAKDRGYTFNERIEYADGSREVKTMLGEAWNHVFYSNCALRPACYNCKYVGPARTSDITIADFWGIEDASPDFYDKKGISLVILNTEKGERAFNEIKDKLILSKQSFEKAAVKNHNLVQPTARPEMRDRFWQDAGRNGYDYIFKKYGRYNAVTAIKRFIKKVIKKA